MSRYYPPPVFSRYKLLLNYCFSARFRSIKDQDGASTCLPCSSSSTSAANATECKCLGLNRAFQVSCTFPEMYSNKLTTNVRSAVVLARHRGRKGDKNTIVFQAGFIVGVLSIEHSAFLLRKSHSMNRNASMARVPLESTLMVMCKPSKTRQNCVLKEIGAPLSIVLRFVHGPCYLRRNPSRTPHPSSACICSFRTDSVFAARDTNTTMKGECSCLPSMGPSIANLSCTSGATRASLWMPTVTACQKGDSHNEGEVVRIYFLTKSARHA